MPDRPAPARDDALLAYLDTLPYDPYPVQERALVAYFESDEGVLVCAPTGTGKTLIAEAAMHEALATGRRAYYTTPLIALTDQKFAELQDAAERWGFRRDDVGLVTGNRSVNPDATVLVVVAEILFNRLLHPDAFDFTDTQAVVMDEFHSFAEPERGVVWELSLALLPKHIRLMLLSATVGNAMPFLTWLREKHGRDLRLVQSTDRRVPLTYHWVGDTLLQDQLVEMAEGSEDTRMTPALVFCFDRARCWDVAETMKGRDLLTGDQQAQLADLLEPHDWSTGAGPKLKRLLMRGVGVHHAGLLPRHRRIVEDLFQRKLLSVCVCTETLAAGMNLPARSVVLTSLVKGPRDNKKLIAASSAQQMFGRAGRPQFDTQGHVVAVAHDDDVKIAKHKLKLDQIPEDTKDPGLLKARKKLQKKAPRRRDGVTYWSDAQFEKLQTAEPGKLNSKGNLPWRLLAYLLDASPDVQPLRDAVANRLMTEPQIAAAQKHLTKQLVTLHQLEYAVLDPPPPKAADEDQAPTGASTSVDAPSPETNPLAALTLGGGVNAAGAPTGKPEPEAKQATDTSPGLASDYAPTHANPTDDLDVLLAFRAVHPLYGGYLLDHLGDLERHERLQVLESVLEMPGSVARSVRVPRPNDLPPSEATLQRIDPLVIQRGIATQDELYPPPVYEQDLMPGERPKFPIPLGDKLALLFQADVPHAGPMRTASVWAAGALLEYEGDFNAFITTRDLQTQEGMIFRHLLRLILLCDEFAAVTPRGMEPNDWADELRELSETLTSVCRAVDPQSTDETLAEVGG